MTGVRTFDPSGAPVSLGKELGRGGEGAVYDIQGRAAYAAKVYLKPPSPAHGEKLSVMAGMAEPKLLSLAAWPTSTLHGPSGSVVGFVMPKVTGHSPVFKLYGPKLRLQEFPKADWRFLIHAAANTARAFSTVHAAGLVVGDVNHGNLVVGQDATVRLIDCDSFQVSKGSRRWFCDVGVGTHQPPEMQGLASYAGVTRTPNHDNFGMAVIIFQLLCMARHPFAGRYLASGNPPTIDEAIAKSQYAYARDQRRTMMAPPPGSLPIDALTPDLQDLFEAAFAPSAANRPPGDRWVSALQQLGSSLRACKQNQAHYYLARLPQCPWCQIEAASGTPLFPVIFLGNPGVGTGIAALWQEVTQTPEPAPLPLLPDPGLVPVPASPSALSAAKKGRTLAIVAYGSIGAAELSALMLASPLIFWVISGAVGLLTAIIMSIAGAKRDDQPFSEIKRDWESLKAAWLMPGSAFAPIRRDLDALKARYDALPALRARRLQGLSEQRRQKQFQDHLDRFSITSARISGIGPAKTAMLASHGIDTAGDVDQSRVMAVPGFGEALTRKLVLWRQTHERTFTFDASRAIAPSEIVGVERDISVERGKLEQEIATGLGRLKAAAAAAAARRQALEGRAAELIPRYAQAAADARVRPGNPAAYKGLIAVAGAAFGATLLSLIPNVAPQAGPANIPRPIQLAISQTPVAVPPVPPPPEKLPAIIAPAPPSAPYIPTPTAIQEPVRAPPPVVHADSQRLLTRQAVNMRSAPDNTSQIVRIVPQGTVFGVYARRDGWVQVGSNTPEGWIYASLLADAP